MRTIVYLSVFMIYLLHFKSYRNEIAMMEALEKVYGKASDTGFGSAVFHGSAATGISAESIALAHYKSFMGSKWDAQSEGKWMEPWKKVYKRQPGASADILTELASVTDRGAMTSIPLLTAKPVPVRAVADPSAKLRRCCSRADSNRRAARSAVPR